MGDNLRWVFST